MKIGTVDIEKVYLGDTEISAIYLGDTKVYESSSFPDWQLGDRLDGKATFVGYFDSTNPDDQSTQRYAFFALDGNYRQGGLSYRTSSTAIDFLPTYNYTTAVIASHLSEITESGTYAMTKVITAGISDFPIYDKANSASVSFNGTTYYGKVPNLVELKAIYENRTVIDNADISGERTLATWAQWDGSTKNRVFAETLKNTSTAFTIADQSGMYQTSTTYGANNKYGVVPIIEIPVPAGHGA